MNNFKPFEGFPRVMAFKFTDHVAELKMMYAGETVQSLIDKKFLEHDP